ncbi:MAG: right-handed parallel beta-helix repeat-containing protein [Minicystis sp.]
MARLHLALLLAALSAAGCGPAHNFVSPTTEQGPPPFIGPQQSAAGGPAPEASGPGPTAPAAAPAAQNLAFFRTQDSNEWVSKVFKVQAAYARVIAVSPDGKAPPTITTSKLDLNALPGTEGNVELKVDVTVRTIDEAARMAKGGDLVAVLPGRYAGFTVGDKPDAGDDKYIHFKAVGAPGDVVIESASREDRNWMINLSAAHHVIIQGFHVTGSDTPGDERPKGPNSGIFIGGDFIRTSTMAHHIAILGNFSHNHAKWGIHSVDSHSVLVQDNLFGLSAREHSAYFSDGSDNYVIRRNVFFGSNSSGLQVNLDALASLQKLSKHPALEVPPFQPTREWALALLKAATEKFGANNFPDGRGFNYIIENNVVNGNGRAGGAAINLAGVRESLIQNNLVYGNHSSGISEWDNDNPFDASRVKPGPQSAAEVTSSEVLPIFGCFSNVVRNNTVLMATRSRPALAVGNGSWGTRAYNNVLVNDEFPSVELLNTSIWRFEGRSNVLDRVNYEGPASWLKTLALSLPDGAHSATGIKQSALATSFVKPGQDPWVIINGKWWSLNPSRPDFHPRPTAVLLAGRGDPNNMPKTDLDGKPRAKSDIGAYVTVSP